MEAGLLFTLVRSQHPLVDATQLQPISIFWGLRSPTREPTPRPQRKVDTIRRDAQVSREITE